MVSGTMGEDYFFPKYIFRTAQIPASLIQWGEANSLAVKYFSPQGDFPDLNPWFLEDFEHSYKDHSLSDFLNAGMYTAFGLLSFFIALFFMLQYINNRENRPYLWLSLANLALTIYFTEMGLMVDIFNPIFFYVVGKASLTVFFLFNTLFLFENFDVFNRRWVKILLICTQGVVLILYILFGRGYSSTMAIFSPVSLIPAAGWLITSAVAMVKSILKGNKDAVIVGIGVAFGLVAAVYDFSFTLVGKEPFFWLQGPGIVLFDVSIFITLALQSIRIQKNLAVYNHDMEEQKEGLTSLLREIGRISGSMVTISSNLDETIQQTGQSMEKISQNSTQMSSQVQSQFEMTQGAGMDVHHMIDASKEVFGELERQSKDIIQTTSVIESMLEEIDLVAGGLEEVSRSGADLEQLSALGEKAMNQSRLSMDEIRDVSGNIYQVVDAMNDLADRTNLLSMNASIEAAHAGVSGRGFAVVAQEIKKLALGSSQKAAEVIEEINRIREKIEEGADNNKNANQAFQQITGKTRETVQRIDLLFKTMNSQRAASENVKSTLEELNNGGQSLHEETKKQSTMCLHLEDTLKKLIDGSNEMNGGIHELFQAIHQVVVAAEEIASLSRKARTEAESLESMTD